MSDAECRYESERDSFGKYLVCDKPFGHEAGSEPAHHHHAFLVGNRKITEWLWAPGSEPFRIDLFTPAADDDRG